MTLSSSQRSHLKRSLSGALLVTLGSLAFLYSPHRNASEDPAQAVAAKASTAPRSPSRTTAYRDLFGDTHAGGKMGSLWFERSFKDGADHAHVIFFATEKAGQSGCQVCGVDIAAIAYKHVSGRWQVVSKQAKVGESVVGGSGMVHGGMKIADITTGRF